MNDRSLPADATPATAPPPDATPAKAMPANSTPPSSTPRSSTPMAAGTILIEGDELIRRGGTGLATYARVLAESAVRLGYEVDGLFDVHRPLSRAEQRLNEVLAFDALDDEEPTLPQRAWRHARYPFNALIGLGPTELVRSGLVVGPIADALRPFRRVLAVTRLNEMARAHFTIYGRLARLRLARRPSLFHATHPVPLAAWGCPNLYTIHDLVPLRLPYATLDDKKYFFRLLTAIGRTADHIVTVSEHSRRDIIEHLKVDERRVTNTWQAVDIPPRLLARSDDDVAHDLASLFGLEPGGYFLFYGAIEPKKNVSRLIDAYAASGSKLPLVIAGGSGWQNSEELKKIDNERFVNFRIDGSVMRRERQVRRLDYLPRDQLVTLLRGARALLFPSIYEGFGLPVIEAMALGTPVVTSKVSSLPEVAGDAALLVDPYSVDDIARAIRTIEADADLRAALAERGLGRARKFSPAAYEERLARLYASL